ncbi:heme oxygenase [Salipaludibacillus sp. LMS25]|nr:heme oxygenase [Salipaludibacillus sp. LMS25]
MIIVTNTSKIKKGNGHKLIERFNKVGKVEFMDGFLGLDVLLTENTQDYEEVAIMTRWESKNHFINWTTSDAFKKSHSKREVPDYILDNHISYHDVKVTRKPLTAVDSTGEQAN